MADGSLGIHAQHTVTQLPIRIGRHTEKNFSFTIRALTLDVSDVRNASTSEET